MAFYGALEDDGYICAAVQKSVPGNIDFSSPGTLVDATALETEDPGSNPIRV
jgi:hypothetical protein